MLTILFGVILSGWLAVAVLGTMAYFLGEQSKPIHERNWRSASFEKLSQSLTNQKIDYAERVPAFTVDSYSATRLPMICTGNHMQSGMHRIETLLAVDRVDPGYMIESHILCCNTNGKINI